MPVPKAKLIVDANGRGRFLVNGVELQVSEVEIKAVAQMRTTLTFHMLADVECEIDPDGARLVLTDVDQPIFASGLQAPQSIE